MAGSLKYFRYTTDLEDEFAIFMDEGNGEAVSNPDYADGGETLRYTIPSNVEPRYAVYGNTEGSRNIRIPICTLLAYNNLDEDVPSISDPLDETQTLRLIRVRPEQRRVPVPTDSGLQDGDAT